MDAGALLSTFGTLLLIFLPAALGVFLGRANRTQLVRSWLIRWQQLRGTTVFEDDSLIVLDKPPASNGSGHMPTRSMIFKSSPGLIQSQVTTLTI